MGKNMQIKEDCGCSKYGTYKQIPDNSSAMYLIQVKEQLTSLMSERIRKDGSNWCVYSKTGKKLGTHETKKSALKQLAAIEIAKSK
jgi:hypothetical protein